MWVGLIRMCLKILPIYVVLDPYIIIIIFTIIRLQQLYILSQSNHPLIATVMLSQVDYDSGIGD